MENTSALYAELPRHVKDMTTAELHKFFPPGKREQKKKDGSTELVPLYTNAFLMRSIIMNEKRFMPNRYTRTLRSMWYSTVKPTLDKLGLLTVDDMTEEGQT